MAQNRGGDFDSDELSLELLTISNTKRNRSAVRSQVMLLAKELERRLLIRIDNGESREAVLANVPPEVLPLLNLDPFDHDSDLKRSSRSSIRSIESESSDNFDPQRGSKLRV
eukprot:CAMPEP_0185852732 /NCGR_PEP_ID=MMETSP1354-20130828/16018_1 /TAXON_ID=708628 /ORGANISM="Erythrolobus madagascarensis, Strain CCMP3276" /LENGTH=111 /DNA_ID=CAMNT_0028554061 /DNA_START=145 /DNA_END=477 /DNA_ORIENTATION=-